VQQHILTASELLSLRVTEVVSAAWTHPLTAVYAEGLADNPCTNTEQKKSMISNQGTGRLGEDQKNMESVWLSDNLHRLEMS
jgi:hypothetical protein